MDKQANKGEAPTLLPCPFCGGEARLEKEPVPSAMYGCGYICCDCPASPSAEGWSMEELADQWNARAEPAPSEETVNPRDEQLSRVTVAMRRHPELIIESALPDCEGDGLAVYVELREGHPYRAMCSVSLNDDGEDVFMLSNRATKELVVEDMPDVDAALVAIGKFLEAGGTQSRAEPSAGGELLHAVEGEPEWHRIEQKPGACCRAMGGKAVMAPPAEPGITGHIDPDSGGVVFEEKPEPGDANDFPEEAHLEWFVGIGYAEAPDLLVTKSARWAWARRSEDIKDEQGRGDLHARINEAVSKALGQEFGETWHDLGEKVAKLKAALKRVEEETWEKATEGFANLETGAKLDAEAARAAALARVEELEATHAGCLPCNLEAERDDARASLSAALEEREKYRSAATVLCGAHIGVPQSACPVCMVESVEEERDERWENEKRAVAALASMTEERDQLRGHLNSERERALTALADMKEERDTWHDKYDVLFGKTADAVTARYAAEARAGEQKHIAEGWLNHADIANAECERLQGIIEALDPVREALTAAQEERDALLAEVGDRQQTEDEIIVALGSKGILWCDIAKEITALTAALASMTEERDLLRAGMGTDRVSLVAALTDAQERVAELGIDAAELHDDLKVAANQVESASVERDALKAENERLKAGWAPYQPYASATDVEAAALRKDNARLRKAIKNAVEELDPMLDKPACYFDLRAALAQEGDTDA